MIRRSNNNGVRSAVRPSPGGASRVRRVSTQSTIDNDESRKPAAAVAAMANFAGANEIITEILPNDILLGRGALAIGNEGNVRFRKLCATRAAQYTSTSRRHIKHEIASDILNTITGRNGRFVRRIEDDAEAAAIGIPGGAGAWVLADEESTLTKIKQSLRDRESEPRSWKKELPASNRIHPSDSSETHGFDTFTGHPRPLKKQRVIGSKSNPMLGLVADPPVNAQTVQALSREILMTAGDSIRGDTTLSLPRNSHFTGLMPPHTTAIALLEQQQINQMYQTMLQLFEPQTRGPSIANGHIPALNSFLEPNRHPSKLSTSAFPEGSSAVLLSALQQHESGRPAVNDNTSSLTVRNLWDQLISAQGAQQSFQLPPQSYQPATASIIDPTLQLLLQVREAELLHQLRLVSQRDYRTASVYHPQRSRISDTTQYLFGGALPPIHSAAQNNTEYLTNAISALSSSTQSGVSQQYSHAQMQGQLEQQQQGQIATSTISLPDSSKNNNDERGDYNDSSNQGSEAHGKREER